MKVCTLSWYLQGEVREEFGWDLYLYNEVGEGFEISRMGRSKDVL